MGLFDDLKGTKNASEGSAGTAKRSENRTESIIFSILPDTLEGFKELSQAKLATPFETAAMTVLALCFYPKDRELSLAMLDFLKGPGQLNPAEKQFIQDRFRDQDYVPRSYFEGAVPGNDYTPSEPYTVRVSENPYSYDNQGYAKLYVACGGADSPRPVTLRQAKDGKWYLWEQFLLVGIRQPESQNPWA